MGPMRSGVLRWAFFSVFACVGNRTGSHQKHSSLALHESGKKRFFCGGQEGLRPLRQIIQERLQASLVELGFRVIHQKYGVEAVRQAMNFHLGKVQRQQRASLLAGGPVSETASLP